MATKDRLSGNEAVASAMSAMNIDVMAAFPITPSTEIPQYFSDYVANGKTKTLFIPVESEHSSISACAAASAAGARSCTATSSCGLALMNEMLHTTASLRLPVTLACATRALTGPINIHNDHSDAMGARDTGWIQLYAATAQEAYDNYIMSVRIAEKVMLPLMVCFDGFITSHAVENIDLLDGKDIADFVGFYEPKDYLLNAEAPMACGPYDSPAYLMEHKRAQAQAMIDAKETICEVSDQFKKLSGRGYDLIECSHVDDAERVIVLLGSSAETAIYVADKLREQGEKVGVIKVRAYRPFPSEEIISKLKNAKIVAVMDKSEGMSTMGGPLFADVATAVTGEKSYSLVNYIYGLGGRDLRPEHIQEVFSDLQDDLDGKPSKAKAAGRYRYLAVRE